MKLYLETPSGTWGASISGFEDFGVSGTPVTKRFSISLTFLS